MINRTPIAAAVVAMTLSVATLAQALAAEGGAIHHLPGAVGGFGVAPAPQPGWHAANVLWVQTGNVGEVVLQGQVDVGVDLDLVLDLVKVTHTFDTKVLGASYTTWTRTIALSLTMAW